jgi:hypothetical protein
MHRTLHHANLPAFCRFAFRSSVCFPTFAIAAVRQDGEAGDQRLHGLQSPALAGLALGMKWTRHQFARDFAAQNA